MAAVIVPGIKGNLEFHILGTETLYMWLFGLVIVIQYLFLFMTIIYNQQIRKDIFTCFGASVLVITQLAASLLLIVTTQLAVSIFLFVMCPELHSYALADF